jgi:hypothetical protein
MIIADDQPNDGCNKGNKQYPGTPTKLFERGQLHADFLLVKFVNVHRAE